MMRSMFMAVLCLYLLCLNGGFAQQEAPKLKLKLGTAPTEKPAAANTTTAEESAQVKSDSSTADTKVEPEKIGIDCLPNDNNEFVFEVNLWEYQYTVEGCEGVAPTLKIKRGVEYTFIQKDVSNWGHPLGLAYYPDGAHDDVPELEEPTPGECDEEQFMCNPGNGVKQAPLYCVNGTCETYEDWNNGVTSGLDVYEPLFQIPEDQWEEKGGEGSYSVKITIPEDSKTAELYYFCHIHSGMSGLMVVEDPVQDANKLVTTLSADYYGTPPEAFDVECGTYDNVTEFHTDMNSFCPGQTFLCDATNTPFSKCMQAIDCKMNYEMRVQEKEANKLAVFMEQMIPHHWNAILMSRIALKHSTDSEGYDDEDLNVPQLMRNIINVQMMQIQQMESWLETYGHKKVQCPVS